MSLRWKILLVILLATIFAYIVYGSAHSVPTGEQEDGDISITDLQKFYAGANDEYFEGRLKTPIIDLDNHDPAESAHTIMRIDGTPLMSFNKKYTLAQRFSYITMLHEMCHADTGPATGDTVIDHGPRWRACMVRIDGMDAFRDQVIDYYRVSRKP